jgi:hypothetical protein
MNALDRPKGKKWCAARKGKGKLINKREQVERL